MANIGHGSSGLIEFISFVVIFFSLFVYGYWTGGKETNLSSKSSFVVVRVENWN